MLFPDAGAVSFRAMACGGLPDDWMERAKAARLVVPVADSGDGDSVKAVNGWSGPRFAGDAEISGSAMAGWIVLSFVSAARVVPAGLLAREVAIEEMAALKASGRGWLKRAERAEIKAEVFARLLWEMPWNYRSLWIAVPEGSGAAGVAFSSALSESDADRLSLAWRNTFSTEIEPLTDEAEALVARVKLADLPAVRYAPGANEVMFCESLGADFLTWLWCRAEMGLPLAKIRNAVIEGLVEEPLTLVLDGNGCKRTVLAKGNVMGAQETKAALMAGKKLAKCKLSLVREGGAPMSFQVDSSLAVRGLRPPKEPGVLSPAERVGARMLAVTDCYAALRAALRAFLKVRTSDMWEAEREQVQMWIQIRKVAG